MTAEGLDPNIDIQAQVDALNNRAWNGLNSDPAGALNLAEQALAFADSYHYERGRAYSWRNSAAAQWMLANNTQALLLAQKALSSFEHLGDREGQIDVLTIFAAIYGSLCEYETALDYQLKALTIAEGLANRPGVSKALSNIGAIYCALGQYPMALDYQLKGLVINHELGDSSLIASSLSSIGDIYLKLAELEKAQEYQFKALDIAKELDNQYDVAHIYQNVGQLYEVLGQYELAVSSQLRALDLFEHISNKIGVAESLIYIGEAYCHSGDHRQALVNFERALAISVEIHALDLKYQIHEAYSKLYERIGDLTNALKHYKLYAEVKKKVINSDNQRAIGAMQIRFNIEKIETEREIFRLRNVELAKANKEIASLNERLKEENIRLSAELEITRRLQQMILPRKAELGQVPGLDIAGFMEPATEVGGDYYDVLQYEGRVKIGIGDVTGHGLESGVVMLMVQTAVRTLLVNQETDPLRFMAAVNRVIYQNVERMNYSKNLTLLLLDYQDGVLRLTGQHEELILIRQDGQLECIETINLGFPLGLEPEISSFIAHREIRLESGDIVILYTDGITEAENLAGAQYGFAQLCAVAQANHFLPAEEIKKAIIEDVVNFIDEQRVLDDIALLVLKQQ